MFQISPSRFLAPFLSSWKCQCYFQVTNPCTSPSVYGNLYFWLASIPSWGMWSFPPQLCHFRARHLEPVNMDVCRPGPNDFPCIVHSYPPWMIVAKLLLGILSFAKAKFLSAVRSFLNIFFVSISSSRLNIFCSKLWYLKHSRTYSRSDSLTYVTISSLPVNHPYALAVF